MRAIFATGKWMNQPKCLQIFYQMFSGKLPERLRPDDLIKNIPSFLDKRINQIIFDKQVWQNIIRFYAGPSRTRIQTLAFRERHAYSCDFYAYEQDFLCVSRALAQCTCAWSRFCFIPTIQNTLGRRYDDYRQFWKLGDFLFDKCFGSILAIFIFIQNQDKFIIDFAIT